MRARPAASRRCRSACWSSSSAPRWSRTRWAVVDAKFAVDAAARQATRSYVEAEIDGAGGGGSDRTRAAEDAAVEAGLAALTAHGRDPAAAQVALTALEPVGGQSGFTRCARATFTAIVRGARADPAVDRRVRARHRRHQLPQRAGRSRTAPGSRGRPRPATDRPRPVAGGDRASVLMLVPAAVLIVLVMASITVDMALVQLRQRQAYDLAAGAANDAATAAADQGALRAGGYRVDADAARRVVERVVAASDVAPEVVGTPAVRVTRRRRRGRGGVARRLHLRGRRARRPRRSHGASNGHRERRLPVRRRIGQPSELLIAS